ncbi:hypothetical protein DM02DRAFT_311331 [Periconia macrospinosa]|uniref:Zn(2)-C6 fungal-type domain-containing protein n=1 Tax=Periconia macrospinosa TaxID=97972 RepID=A0A2V1DZG0_9PLEO|nr:hypothetical protein DM02DRAFT_311331 [Periconia macrospinosa]
MPYPKPENRKRVYKPKTSSGCKTCKVRRIKCDEIKPHCRRCTSTGRKCDGYAVVVPIVQPPVDRIEQIPGLFSRAQSTGLLATTGLQPRHSTPSVIGATLPLDVRHDLSSAEERSSFHFYNSYVSHQLSGFFTSTFWTHEVLVAAKTFPAIRYAVVALGAMHRRYAAGFHTGWMSSTVSASMERNGHVIFEVVPSCVRVESMSDKEMKFALMQANRAIREISSPAKQVDRITVLAVCTLFNCMACLQGRYLEATEHLRSGLKILREIDDHMEGAGFDNSTTLQRVEHPVRLRSLRSILIGLDVQARQMRTGVAAKDEWVPAPRHGMDMSKIDYVSGGLGLEDVKIYLESTLNEFLAWIQGLRTPRTVHTRSESTILKEFYGLKEQAEKGERLLNILLSRFSETDKKGYRQATTALRLLESVVNLGLRAFEVKFLDRSKTGEVGLFDNEDHFDGMMKMVEDLMEPESSPDPEPCYLLQTASLSINKPPLFTFSFGILTTLWWIAQQTPRPSQRIKAIKLMLKYPRREACWDGPMAGKIAWEAVLLEQQSVRDEFGIFGGTEQLAVPEHLRIRSVEMEYVGSTGIRIRFKNMRAVEQGKPGWTRTLIDDVGTLLEDTEISKTNRGESS